MCIRDRLIVSFLAFLAFSIIPGDPTAKILGMDASPEQIAALRSQLGLDRPVLIRYWEWLTNFLRGDFGTSYSYSMPVGQMLADKLPVTAALTLISFLFTVVLSIPLGILAGSVRSKVLDHIITAVDQIFMSIPQFFIGIIMCFTLGLTFRLFVPGEMCIRDRTETAPAEKLPGLSLLSYMDYLFSEVVSVPEG